MLISHTCICEKCLCTSCEQTALCMILIMVVTCLYFQLHHPSSLYPQCVCSFSFSFPLSLFDYLIYLIIHAHTHTHTLSLSLCMEQVVQYRFHIYAISGLVTVKFSFKILTPQLTMCLKRRAWYKPSLFNPPKLSYSVLSKTICQLRVLVTLSLPLPHPKKKHPEIISEKLWYFKPNTTGCSGIINFTTSSYSDMVSNYIIFQSFCSKSFEP